MASGAAATLPISCQHGNRRPIARDQGLFLRTAPAFDPSLCCQCFLAGREVLTPDQFDRAPSRRVTAERAAPMLTDALFEIVSVASVVRAIDAAQEVSVEGHCPERLALRSVLRQAQDERIWSYRMKDGYVSESRTAALPPNSLDNRRPPCDRTCCSDRARKSQTFTTFCSIAPNTEWPTRSRISMRTASPQRRNGVFGVPVAIVSTMRCSAMHE